jgi:5-methyltetrahydrofolate--homocysteine methyltransferase
MNSITERVLKGQILVSDGAWGTFLQKMGLPPGECPETWCLTHREQVLTIARSYIDAGADMIESNSFGANRFKLEHFNLQSKVLEINRSAASISREAAGPDRHVIASVGPTGKMLLMGEVTEQQLYDAFAEQALGLEQGGADAVCIETFTAIDEAELAVRAAREKTSLEVICTFTFDRTAQGEYRTMMGVSPAAMAQAMIQAGAHIIGTNCGNGMKAMAEIVKELRAAAPSAPILVHANAGAPVIRSNITVFPEGPAEMVENARSVIKAGAQIIGGCCGTTPDHIRALAEMVKHDFKRKETK